MMRRMFSLFLVLVLILAVVPVQVLAEETAAEPCEAHIEDGAGFCKTCGDEVTHTLHVGILLDGEEWVEGFKIFGSGVYQTGSIVALAFLMPEAPFGYKYVFEGWENSGGIDLGFEDASAFTTRYCMPPYDESVYAKLHMETLDGEEVSAREVLAGSKAELKQEEHVAYLSGYEDGTIRPNQNITRAEVASMIYRLMTVESKKLYQSDECAYSDVADDAWYRDAVATLSNANILKGYADNTFGAGKPISRAEFAMVLVRFSGSNTDAESSFADVPADHWAAKAIALCKEKGWVTGYGDDTFQPDRPITRAEAAVMINRMLERHCEAWGDVTRSWSDVSADDWYYRDLVEAGNTHEVS